MLTDLQTDASAEAVDTTGHDETLSHGESGCRKIGLVEGVTDDVS